MFIKVTLESVRLPPIAYATRRSIGRLLSLTFKKCKLPIQKCRMNIIKTQNGQNIVQNNLISELEKA